MFRYKGKDVDPQKAGSALKVRAVLTGRVAQRGGALNIQAELVDLARESQLWGRQYDRTQADILVLQEEIAREVAGKLGLALSGDAEKRLAKRYTEQIDAYQLYLKGRHYWSKRTTDGLKKGVEFFQQAIDADPNYALAYAGLAQSYSLFSFYSLLPPREAFPKAKLAAMKAVAIDATLAEGHIALAHVSSRYDWDNSAAEREFRRALELNPKSPDSHQWYGLFLAQRGRHDEALSQALQARDLDPLALILNNLVGRVAFFARQYDRALQEYRKILEMDASFRTSLREIGEVYAAKGMFAESIAAFHNALALDASDPHVIGLLGYSYGRAGQRAEAEGMLRKLAALSKQRYVSPYDTAAIYAGLGRKDETLAWLERAYQDRDDWLVQLNVDPTFDIVRGDPRFHELLRRAGLA